MFMDVSQPFGVGYMVEDVNGKQHRVHFPAYPFARHQTADGRVWVTAECLRVSTPDGPTLDEFMDFVRELPEDWEPQS